MRPPPILREFALEEPMYHMMVGGAFRRGKILEDITIKFNDQNIQLSAPRGMETDFSSIPAALVSIVCLAVLAILHIESVVVDILKDGLLPLWWIINGVIMLGLGFFALLPRGSLFPAGVLHDALYRGKGKWQHIDSKKIVAVQHDRAFADALYRELIIDYGGQRPVGVKLDLMFPLRFMGAWVYWAFLRVFGFSSWSN